MIHGAKELRDGTVIYRRGIGHVMKALALIKTADMLDKAPPPGLVFILREFTDIRFPRLVTRFNRQRAVAVTSEVLAWNIPASGKATPTGEKKEPDYNDLAARIVDSLAAAYGWTKDYIFDRIDFATWWELQAKIRERKRDDGMLDMIKQHNPTAGVKIFDKMAGIEKVDLEELIKKKAAEIQAKTEAE